jgi:spermidine/putrescine transport system ATP-binding protein
LTSSANQLSRWHAGISPEAPPPPQCAISLRGVSKRYGRQFALHETDLDVAEGEFFCLLGPSGSGKTTTLNLVGGFVAPTGGEIHIRGERVDRLPPHKRDVNTVFQSYALFPNMTVAQNIGFGLKMARLPRAEVRRRVQETLALVGLEGLDDRLPAQLSGGQQQRVAVGRALVNRPAVLLLDEPLGALDLKLRRRLQVQLAQIHREIRTVFVYVTHDQEEAMALADRIAVMRDGRIEQIGSPRDVYLRPASRFVAGFIGESNFFPMASAGARQGRATLATGVEVPCADSASGHGSPAALMVRPESIGVSPAPLPDACLPGEVLHTSFLGNFARVAVACDASPEPVVAEIHGRDRAAAEQFTPGSAVFLSWEPEAATVVRDSHPAEEDRDVASSDQA